MAKNIFEQLISRAGEIWSGPKTPQHAIYQDENPPALSGVAKYLAQQEQAAAQKTQEPERQSSAQLTGVAKYLARRAQTAEASESAPAEAVAAEAVQPEPEPVPTTGVAKYLARLAGGAAEPAKAPQPAAERPDAPEPAPTSRVGRYLARLAAGGTTEPAKAPEVPPKTGVGKYLAGIPITRPAPADSRPVEPKADAKPAPSETETAAETPSKTKRSAARAKAPAAAVNAAADFQYDEVGSKSDGEVIHFDNITQCQAQTGKGSRCKNTSNLTEVSRTVDKQKYQFMVCAHHRTDSFKPHPSFLAGAQR